MLLCARLKGWEGAGEKTGSAETGSADGEQAVRDCSADVAKLSSESSPLIGHRE